MTKELNYDLHFTDTEIVAVSGVGHEFLETYPVHLTDRTKIYKTAIQQGLHVRFETVQVRDVIAQV